MPRNNTECVHAGEVLHRRSDGTSAVGDRARREAPLRMRCILRSGVRGDNPRVNTVGSRFVGEGERRARVRRIRDKIAARGCECSTWVTWDRHILGSSDAFCHAHSKRSAGKRDIAA